MQIGIIILKNLYVAYISITSKCHYGIEYGATHIVRSHTRDCAICTCKNNTFLNEYHAIQKFYVKLNGEEDKK